MSVIMYCPSLCCPSVLSTSESHRGQIVECAECGIRFRVPGKRSPRPPADPPKAVEPVIEIVFEAADDGSTAVDAVSKSRRPADFQLQLASYIDFGASPRASIALAVAGRATALLDGRDAVTPDDIKAVAPAALRHRILPTYYAVAEKISTDDMIAEILETVKVP